MLVGDVEVVVGSVTVEWTCPLHSIDGDGAPTCYHPQGRPAGALDVLANAGHAGDWYGVVTDSGRRSGQPVVQPPGAPAPGFYVTATALRNERLARTDQRSYVDASMVPYLSVPPELLHAGVTLGDLGLAISAGRAVPIVVADVGPHRRLGEGSVALAQGLGVPHSPFDGGDDERLVHFTVYRGSSKGWPRSADEVAKAVAKHAQENVQ